MKREWIALFLCLGLLIFFPGCKNIFGIDNDMPEHINGKEIIILEGVSSSEYIEFIVKGEISNFQHIKLDWDNKKII